MYEQRFHVDEGVARPMTSLQAAPDTDLTSEALRLALNALHIDIAWHAGMMSAEAAMEGLHREIGKTINRCNESTRTVSLDPADRPKSHKPMRHRTSWS
jgi:hypothetical protein